MLCHLSIHSLYCHANFMLVRIRANLNVLSNPLMPPLSDVGLLSSLTERKKHSNTAPLLSSLSSRHLIEKTARSRMGTLSSRARRAEIHHIIGVSSLSTSPARSISSGPCRYQKSSSSSLSRGTNTVDNTFYLCALLYSTIANRYHIL